MHTKLVLKLLLAALVAANAGCAAQDRAKLFRAQGYAAHDPAPGRALHEQLPAWDDAVSRHCGAHLRPEQRKPGQSRWC